jgi:D-alanyl-D-alanine carboxypeptidase
MAMFKPWAARRLAALVVFTLAAVGLEAQPAATLTAEQKTEIDGIARKVMEKSGIPSATLAVVADGKLAYAQAYGKARLEPPLDATTAMPYSIGSISKQFTAALILMLQEEGKLSLDDKVGKWLPDLTDAKEITIRQLLSMTSGYQDFWPQDYVMPMMLKATTADAILNGWARKPLDFEPGTKWQYSNTNYVIAGLIVEKASGKPLYELLQEKVLHPLAMTSALNTDAKPMGAIDPLGYIRYALGPLRPAPEEGAGWMFAAGELAMTPSDLAKWDISLMNESLLKPPSYLAMETETVLKNGLGTRYGLGMFVMSVKNHRVLEHGGEVSGFTAENIVLPDDKFAVIVTTNQDAVSASGEIGRQILSAYLNSLNAGDPKQDALVRKVFDGLRQGKIDRGLFTDNANFYFSEQALKDYENSLSPLGTVESFRQTSNSLRGGMTHMLYEVKFKEKKVGINIYQMPDGKLEQYLIAAQD